MVGNPCNFDFLSEQLYAACGHRSDLQTPLMSDGVI